MPYDFEGVGNLSEHDAEVVSVLEKALETGLTVEFEYDGLPRLVEVHAIGLSTAGRPCFRGYQVAGESKTEAVAWKMFSIGKVFTFPKLIDIKTAAPREGYQKGDKGMSYIFKEL